MPKFVTFFPCMLHKILKFILRWMKEENANIIYCLNQVTCFYISDPNVDVFVYREVVEGGGMVLHRLTFMLNCVDPSRFGKYIWRATVFWNSSGSGQGPVAGFIIIIIFIISGYRSRSAGLDPRRYQIF